jgi:hypothetical protein
MLRDDYLMMRFALCAPERILHTETSDAIGMQESEDAMTPVTLDQVLALAHQLPRAQRADLIAHLSRDLAAELAADHDRTGMPDTMTPSQAHAALADIRAAFSTLPQPRRTLGEQLEHDRDERQAGIEGTSHDHA